MLVLTVIAGPEPGRNLELSGDRPLIFGRFSIIGEQVDDKLSRRHAVFRRDNHRWTVQDLGSRNGTLLNGHPISDPMRLREGDEIRMGKTVLGVSIVNEAEVPDLPVPQPGPRAVSPSATAAPSPPIVKQAAAKSMSDAMDAPGVRSETGTRHRDETPVSSQPSDTRPVEAKSRPDSPLHLPPVPPSAADAGASGLDLEADAVIELEPASNESSAGELMGVEALDESDLSAIAAEVDGLLAASEPMPMSDDAAHDVEEIEGTLVDDTSGDVLPEVKPKPEAAASSRMVADALVDASPRGSARPGEAARGAERKTTATPTPAPSVKPRSRGRGRRAARFAVITVLLLFVGVTGVFVYQSWGEGDRLTQTQQNNERIAAEVARSQTPPPPAATSPPTHESASAVPHVTPVPGPPPTSTPTVADRTPRADPAIPTPAVTIEEPWPVLDPFRSVDSLAGAMGSGGRIVLPDTYRDSPRERVDEPLPTSPASRDSTPEPSPLREPEPTTTLALTTPRPETFPSELPELPDTQPLVKSSAPGSAPGNAQESTSAEIDSGVPTVTADPGPTRPREPRIRPAPLDDAERLVFLVDASGSMIDTLPLVIQELDRIIAQLRPEQRFTVLFYQKDQVIEVPPAGMKEATRRNKVLISRWMDPKSGNILAVGPSYPLEATKIALSYQPDQIFLLADKIGASVQARELGQRFLTEIDSLNTDRAVQVNAVHFFYPDANQSLASLAAAHKGTYRFVSLDEVVSESNKAGDPLRDSLMLLLEDQP